MKVPFVDLVLQYKNIKSEIDAAMQDVIDNAAFIGGERVERFECAFAEQHNAKYCIGTSSGTAALHLILWSLGIGAGDGVIVPINTFAATAEAVALTGAKPVFVDCINDYNIDTWWVLTRATLDMDERNEYPTVEEWQTALMDRGRLQTGACRRPIAIMPVHLYGKPANMDAILTIAKAYHLLVIEDCCQAHNATYNGAKVGTFGVAGAFSFYPSKNLGGFGDGGAVITNDESLYKEMRTRQNHGQAQKGRHEVIGHNYRLDGLQAAVLNVKLKYLDAWTEQRRFLARQYFDALKDISEALVPLKDISEVFCPERNVVPEHVFHLFVVRAQRRDELRSYLYARGIETGIHYPIPLHLQPSFAYLGYKKGDFPNAEKYATEILSLPMYPELTKEQIEYVAQQIWTFYHI